MPKKKKSIFNKIGKAAKDADKAVENTAKDAGKAAEDTANDVAKETEKAANSTAKVLATFSNNALNETENRNIASRRNWRRIYRCQPRGKGCRWCWTGDRVQHARLYTGWYLCRSRCGHERFRRDHWWLHLCRCHKELQNSVVNFVNLSNSPNR